MTNYLGINPILGLDLLEILEKNNFDVLEEVLENVLTSFKLVEKIEMEPYDEDFYQREEVLNSYRDFLLKIFASPKSSTALKESILRVILVIANLRSSGEDYLIVYNLLSSEGLNPNLEPEIFMNKYFQKDLTNSEENKSRFVIKKENPEYLEFFLKEDNISFNSKE